MTAVYGADLETDNNADRAWVVQWAIVNGKTLTVEKGTCLEDIKQTLIMLALRDRKCFVYFHNLTYDAAFLLPILDSLAAELNGSLTIIKPESKIITIRIKHENGVLHIRDSMAKMPGDLKALAATVGMTKYEGFEWSPGWSFGMDFSDPDVWDYVVNDAKIVAVAMQKLHKMGFSSATASGDSWRKFKNDFGPEWRWDKHFPKFSFDFDLELRQSYTGGLNFSNNKGFNASIPGREIKHLDVNSMYPWAMRNHPMPYGKPTIDTGLPANDTLFIVKFYGKISLKQGKFPIFMFKQKIDCLLEDHEFGTPVKKTEKWHKFVWSSVDLDTYAEFYEIEVDPETQPIYYVFKKKEGMFNDFIDKNMEIKKKAPKGSLEREKAKLNMNGLYGRFALNPERTDTVLTWNDELGDHELKQKRSIVEDNDAFLPVSIFVTSWARRLLIESIDEVGWDNLIHADTDSMIFFSNGEEDLDIGDELGQWKIESEPECVIEGGVKRYIELLNIPLDTLNDVSMAAAGIPQKTDLSGKVPVGMWVELLDDPIAITSDQELGRTDYRIKSTWIRDIYLKHGRNPDNVNTMKLLPKKVPGGVILVGTTYKLNDRSALQFRKRGRPGG